MNDSSVIVLESQDENDLTCRNPKRLKNDIKSNENEKSCREEKSCEVKWEDLPSDCLVCVFRKLGVDDLVLNAPFVCKSWYWASLDPSCWKTLNFHAIDTWAGSEFTKNFKLVYRVDRFTLRGFLKFVIARSNKSATTLILNENQFTLKNMVYICKECPWLNIFISNGAELGSTYPVGGLFLKMHEAIRKLHGNS